MSRIRSKNTKPEISVRSMLHGMGYRFRLHDPKLPGKPDIVMKKYRTVIFCHGCYWHRHPNCKRATMPKTNKKYWKAKFNRNKERFKQVRKELNKQGWNIIVIWECQTKKEDKLRRILEEKMGAVSNEV